MDNSQECPVRAQAHAEHTILKNENANTFFLLRIDQLFILQWRIQAEEGLSTFSSPCLEKNLRLGILKKPLLWFYKHKHTGWKCLIYNTTKLFARKQGVTDISPNQHRPRNWWPACSEASQRAPSRQWCRCRRPWMHHYPLIHSLLPAAIYTNTHHLHDCASNLVIL